MAKITFVVSGVDRGSSLRGRSAPVDASIPGELKQSVRVTAQRASAADIQVEAVPGEDVVVLHIANGPSLYLHPETARELLAAQHDPAKRSGSEGELDAGKVRVPVRLQWRGEEAVPTRGASRGFLGDVLVEGIDVIGGLVKELITDKAADFAASKVVKRFDERVTEGVYALKADQLASLKGTAVSEIPAGEKPSLVLIHGTFSDTFGTFQKLWTEHPTKVGKLFEAHNGVFALDHATLGSHPVSNALTLAKALQPGARLRLLTHSRGGLVGEVLARAATMQPQDVGSPEEWTKKDIADLRSLVTMLHAKKVTIERVVRVACPARGTLLASKRVDAYVSGVKWALRLAGVPVVPEFLAFLAEVARRRAEPEMLPGLAAQIPDSPLVQWLHTGDTRIAGDLRVVAGDMQGDAVVSWMKTLLSDAFFWTDNDLVVQTRSMYGGTPREADSLFLLNRGGHVSHFSYFANPETATAIVAGLTDATPGGFKVIGPLSWAGSSATGERAGIVKRTPKAAAALPALVVLPGILGSNLKVGKDRVWLAWRLANGFKRLAYDPASPDTVAHDGPLDLFYENLISFLSNDHDVSSCAFDWRRPIEDSANVLADLIEKLLDERKSTGQPVRLIAHSMGGVVARTMQLVRPKTWKRMMDVQGARLLMLGTPNGGSFAPMQMLSGDDTFGNLLTMVGAPFRGHETRELIAQFPGLLQLQAGLLNGLGQEAQWRKLAAEDLASLERASFWHRLPLQLKQARWGIPTQPVLNAAAALRRRLDEQVRKELPALADKVLLVVGKAAFTPTGYELTREGLVYLGTREAGDGRVPLASALLPGVRTWTINCEHGSLPKKREAFEAYRELLANGDTKRLSPLSRAATARSAATEVALVRSRPARAIFATAAPPEDASEILESRDAKEVSGQAAVPEGGFEITVVNGDLTYVEQPLILGHYRSSRLTGAEAVMDRAMGGAMSASLQRGRYPEGAGECQVFLNTRNSPDNPWQLPRPKAVIVAGLGAENELRGTDLVQTVRQAVIAWAQRLTEMPDPPAAFKVATTLLGSGGSGVSPGQAAQLIAQGVREANVRISQEQNDGARWPRVGELRIIELYLSRASEAWQSLCLLAESLPTLYKVHPAIEPGIGGLRRPLEAGYRGADYDFISALVQHDEAQKEQVVYTIDTKRARSEVRTQGTQLPLIRTLVQQASNSANNDAQIGRTLFSLLVPVDLEAFMASSGATVLELDRGTAPIPWELLDSPVPGSADERPWAVRTKLLRKLRTNVRGQSLQDASADDNVLVIGDPACDRTTYPTLYGARREAVAVANCLSKASAEQAFGPKVKTLISAEDDCAAEPTMQEVLNAAMAGPWRIIHIAGHGEPPAEIDGKITTRGVVLSDKSFLGPDEIRALRFAPELVFVNCCHLASADASALSTTNYDRTAFASGVAEALISAGVRCVIAAGWAVDDAAAEAFATAFYTRLLAGASFIDAVAVARQAARDKGGNTWAAYQCYGDPDWRYRPYVTDAQTVAPTLAQEFAGIGSGAALRLALDTMGVQSEFQGAKEEKQVERLRYLEASTTRFWQGSGELAEAFGHAWAKLGKFPEAITWYERARTMPDGTASLAAVEQLANLKVRHAWKSVDKMLDDDAARTRARKEIGEAMRLLDRLLAIGPTIERESIYGSAYKRLAMIEGAAGDAGKEARAIEQMKLHYGEAEKIALKALEADPAALVNFYYPAMNRLAADIALGAAGGAEKAADPRVVTQIRDSMASVAPTFYSVVGQTEISVYASLLAGTITKDVKRLVDEFKAHHERVSAPKMWGSVYENAMFVLGKYRERAEPAERGAVQVLLSALARFAGQPEPGNGSVPTPAKPADRKTGPKSRRAPRVAAGSKKPRQSRRRS